MSVIEGQEDAEAFAEVPASQDPPGTSRPEGTGGLLLCGRGRRGRDADGVVLRSLFSIAASGLPLWHADRVTWMRMVGPQGNLDVASG